VVNFATTRGRKGSKIEALRFQPAPRTKFNMNPEGGAKGSIDLSEELGIIDLGEEESDEVTRQKLRDWARKYNKGEVYPSTFAPSSGKDDVQQAESQDKDGEKYQLPDWSQHMAKVSEKKPAGRARHNRQSSSHQIAFKDHQASRPQIYDPDIPPVPPIPEKYRAEWEWQEMKRRAELTNEDYPPFIPGGQKGLYEGKYARKPQVVSAAPKFREEIRRVAAKRANERRRRAYDAVVLEDQPEQENGRGRENERAGEGAKFEDKQFVRTDGRLPRSPGMLNLAQERLKEPNASPDESWPLTGLPEALVEQNAGDNGHGCNKVEEQSMLDRPLRDMTRAYIESIDFESEVAEVEVKAKEKQKQRTSMRK
jgi:hypothetical protein